MRLWKPSLDGYNDRAQTLTRRLPDQPAAVPIYLHGRTRLLALDFDSTRDGVAAVERDVQCCLAWIREAGGRAITDYSTSGGRHILIPLPLGVTLDLAQAESLMRLLAARLSSLDITPMLNPATGCITPPGSRCKQGGYRRLDSSLDDAIDTLRTRSAPGFVARLHHLLAGIAHDATIARAARATSRAARAAAAVAHDMQLWGGDGECARLRAEYRRRGRISTAVTAFARDGAAPPDGRWTTRAGRLDRSAARQSVLAAAVVRGYSYLDVRAQLPTAGGSWRGFADAYRRYGRGADAAMHRDWISACRWAERTAPEFLSVAHKKKDTGGSAHNPAAHTQQRWLAAATLWTHAQWPRSPRRWTVLAVLQALAWASAVGGHLTRGVPIVEFGGRSLSLTAGDLPESTVWGVLRELRDLPGAPILRTRAGRRLAADRYALVTPRSGHRPVRPDHIQISRMRVEPVHPAWTVLGLHCRRLHELITRDRLTTPADVFAAAWVSPSAGYNALAILTTAGLINHTHGHLQQGTVSLDDIAHAHGLHQQRIQRLAHHHQHRAAWKHWLSQHHRPTPLPLTIHTAPTQPQSARAATAHHPTADNERQPNPRRATALASGPPRSGSAGVGECPSRATIPAVVAAAAAAPGTPARGVRAVAVSESHEDSAWLEPTGQRAHASTGRAGDRAPTAARATRPRTVVEIYVEASDTPIAGGRWLIATDATVIYERPTGVLVASTVPASLLRHSPSWTCVFRRGRIGDSAKQCHR
ncbi:hypothetical protein [Nocardia amamiensis]|nr:hypothetical protein [Nocardia amamiensis]